MALIRMGANLLLASTALVLLPWSAIAQSDFQSFYSSKQATVVPPTGGQTPAPQREARFTSNPPVVAGVAYNPYVSYRGAGGYLAGQADVIGAQGQLMVDQQDAYLKREQVRQSKVDTRRKNFDEAQYERAMTPTQEQEREFRRVENLQRSQNRPPVTEILSGKALNDVYNEIQIKRLVGPSVPINPRLLSQINFTSSSSGSEQGLGLLKGGKNLEWTEGLLEDVFNKDRDKVEKLMQELNTSLQTEKVDGRKARETRKAVSDMKKSLDRNIDELSAGNFMEAKRYLNQLIGSLDTLSSADAANYLDNRWQGQVNSVAGLVAEMNSRGLHFAPAVAGEEASYQALHRALASYSMEASSAVAAAPR